jgi:hypothetical protein
VFEVVTVYNKYIGDTHTQEIKMAMVSAEHTAKVVCNIQGNMRYFEPAVII